MHYLLFYDVVDNYAEKRTPFRKDHLAHAKAAVARGELLSSTVGSEAWNSRDLKSRPH